MYHTYFACVKCDKIIVFNVFSDIIYCGWCICYQLNWIIIRVEGQSCTSQRKMALLRWYINKMVYIVSPYIVSSYHISPYVVLPLIARFMGPTWDPPGSCRPQVGPMWAPWTLFSGTGSVIVATKPEIRSLRQYTTVKPNEYCLLRKTHDYCTIPFLRFGHNEIWLFVYGFNHWHAWVKIAVYNYLSMM